MTQKTTKIFGIVLAAVVLAALLIVFASIQDKNEATAPTATPIASSSPEVTNLPTDTQAQADKAKLMSQTWTWIRTTMNDDTLVTPNSLEAFTLNFQEDGTVGVSTDCNSMTGSYRILAPAQIEFSQFASTMMFCEGSQETDFSQMIQDSTGYMFTDEGKLVLLLKYDSGSVLFE